jgi:hypothetical protein
MNEQVKQTLFEIALQLGFVVVTFGGGLMVVRLMVML